MALIRTGIVEILQGKDPNWAGYSNKGLLGALQSIGEAFLGGVAQAALGVATDFLSELNPFAQADGRAMIGDKNKVGGGISEYGYARDEAAANSLGYMDGAVFKVGQNPAAQAALQNWDVNIKRARINSVLEERSYVDFYFPNESIGRRRVAFFENASIREDRTARYATQNIVARNEPARLFTGADARKVKLTFTYTLPHIEQFFGLCNKAGLVGFQNLSASSFDPIHAEYRRVLKQHLDEYFGTRFSTQGASFTNESLDTGPRAYEPGISNIKKGITEEPKTVEGLISAISKNDEDLTSNAMMATYYTQFVIDTIRASVIGDQAANSAYGPPIVKFRHGTVFSDDDLRASPSPFIVKNFSIDYPTDKGYEYRSLTPRQVKFSLSLEEYHQTHGSHHGTDNYQVPNASDLVKLTLGEL